MAKLKPNEKRVQLSFQRPDDLALYGFLEKRAYERRYDLSTFIMLSLHEAFEGQYEVWEPPVAAESLPKMPESIPAALSIDMNPPTEEQLIRDIHEHGKVTSEPPSSTDDGYESTKAAIAANNALYAKQRKPRKGVIPGADTTPENPPASPK